MSDNVATVQQAIERLNSGDLDGYMSMYSPAARFVGYPVEVPPTFDGIRAFYGDLLRAIENLSIEAIDIFPAGQRVVVRYLLGGDHTGELLGAPPTAHQLAVEGLTILYFDEGKVVHRVNRLDDLAFLNQIGIIPTPGATSTG
jgi:predicted ester cyclase